MIFNRNMPKKYSNFWDKDQYPSNLFYINITWIIPKIFFRNKSSIACLWYCKGDMPCKLEKHFIYSDNFIPNGGHIAYGNDTM